MKQSFYMFVCEMVDAGRNLVPAPMVGVARKTHLRYLLPRIRSTCGKLIWSFRAGVSCFHQADGLTHSQTGNCEYSATFLLALNLNLNAWHCAVARPAAES